LLSSNTKVLGFNLLSHGSELEAQFFGSLLDVVSVKLLDIFEISCEQDEGVKSGKRSHSILQKRKKLDIVRPTRAVGDG
jgi:hypothetical protein